MFSPTRESSVCSLGESRLIRHIEKWLGRASPEAPAGMGDDCAVIEVFADKRQLLTTDSLTYGQHFNDAIGPVEAGAKLIKRNLSDIAAMGGQPGPALLNLLMGPDLSINWLESFVSGIRECSLQYDLPIVGGDVSQLANGHFTAALTLSGWIDTDPKLRSGSRIGDAIYLTGSLGGSIIQKHYAFEPRLREGQWLARQKAVTAMMDLTDGLGKDLDALLPASASAAIDLARLPVSEDAVICAKADGKSAQAHAFCDGEDYELLFTVNNSTAKTAFEKEWKARFAELKLSCIGQIVEKNPAGRYIEVETNQALPWSHGFEHFKAE